MVLWFWRKYSLSVIEHLNAKCCFYNTNFSPTFFNFVIFCFSETGTSSSRHKDWTYIIKKRSYLIAINHHQYWHHLWIQAAAYMSTYRNNFLSSSMPLASSYIHYVSFFSLSFFFSFKFFFLNLVKDSCTGEDLMACPLIHIKLQV